MGKRANARLTATFDLDKDRLSWKDVLWTSVGALFLLGMGALIGLGAFDDQAAVLPWANSITLVATAFTIGGLLFPRWRRDIEIRGTNRIDEIWAQAAQRTAEAGSWWQFWDRSQPKVVLNDDEQRDLESVTAALRSNDTLLNRVEFASYVAFAIAVFSGGASIAAELHSIFS